MGTPPCVCTHVGLSPPAIAAPTHADPWSTEALLRLFAELKLDPSERCAYSLVAPHPLGKLLLAMSGLLLDGLSACTNYVGR